MKRLMIVNRLTKAGEYKAIVAHLAEAADMIVSRPQCGGSELLTALIERSKGLPKWSPARIALARMIRAMSKNNRFMSFVCAEEWISALA